MWETPDYYCDGIITGYQVQFYDAVADTQTMSIQDVPENKTFYVVQEKDRLGGPHNTTIRVCSNISNGLDTVMITINFNLGACNDSNSIWNLERRNDIRLIITVYTSISVLQLNTCKI